MRNNRNNYPQTSTYYLTGNFCPGKEWNKENIISFKMKLVCSGVFQAKEKALFRLKAFCRRKKEETEIKSFFLQGVCLKNQQVEFCLQNKFKNNNILYATKSNLVWQ